MYKNSVNLQLEETQMKVVLFSNLQRKHLAAMRGNRNHTGTVVVMNLALLMTHYQSCISTGYDYVKLHVQNPNLMKIQAG